MTFPSTTSAILAGIEIPNAAYLAEFAALKEDASMTAPLTEIPPILAKPSALAVEILMRELAVEPDMITLVKPFAFKANIAGSPLASLIMLVNSAALTFKVEPGANLTPLLIKLFASASTTLRSETKVALSNIKLVPTKAFAWATEILPTTLMVVKPDLARVSA